MPTLVSTETSPYGRKVRIVADILGVADRLPLRPADPRDPDDPLRTLNPLGKMPVLVLDDGSTVYDSRVIVDWLETAHGSGAVIPRDPAQRARELTLAALADGILDALLLVTYEGRFRTPEQASAVWLDHQFGKVRRGLDHAAGRLEAFAPPGIAAVTLACALGYADWRKQLDWRAEYPALADWLARFAEAVPGWERTRAPAPGR